MSTAQQPSELVLPSNSDDAVGHQTQQHVAPIHSRPKLAEDDVALPVIAML